MGDYGESGSSLNYKTVTYDHPESGLYRKLIVKRGRLVGAIAVGEWPQLNRIQETITNRRLVLPWQLRRFASTGGVWPDDIARHVRDWPASTTVCNCTGVTRGDLSKAISNGNATIAELKECTGASSICGSCRHLLADLTESSGLVEPDKASRPLLWTSAAGLILALLTLFSPILPYSSSADVVWQWDVVWRESLFKKISGFTLLGLSLLILTISLRKRIRKMALGDFSLWRFLHTAIGMLVIVSLFVHTGFRLGENLNAFLMLFYSSLLVFGALAGGVISLEHKLDAAIARRIKRSSIWIHIILFWPVPVLLGFHVFKTFYF